MMTIFTNVYHYHTHYLELFTDSMTLHRSYIVGISDLSTELLLHIASFLSQVDLLNISLTDKHLRGCTEPELYREYTNVRPYGRSFKPFLRRMIERPDLTRHVRRLELRW